MDISFTVCFVFLLVCTVTDFSGEDKSSGVKFCKEVYRRPRQEIFHFGELCSPEARNQTNRRAANARRIGMPPLTSAVLVLRSFTVVFVIWFRFFDILSIVRIFTDRHNKSRCQCTA